MEARLYPYRVMRGSIVVTRLHNLDTAIDRVRAENQNNAGRLGFIPRRVVDAVTEQTVYPVETNS